jgi:hypothetical protein
MSSHGIGSTSDVDLIGTCICMLPDEQGAATNKGVFTTVVSFVPGGGTVFAPDAPAVMDEINGNTIEGALALAQVGRRRGVQPQSGYCSTIVVFVGGKGAPGCRDAFAAADLGAQTPCRQAQTPHLLMTFARPWSPLMLSPRRPRRVCCSCARLPTSSTPAPPA